MSFWTWVGRHARAVKLGSMAAAVALLCGGLALGMTQAAGGPAARPEGAPQAAAVVVPSRHYLVGTISLVTAPGRAIVRSSGGRLFVVEYDRETVVRRDRQRTPLTALRRGTRVIVLGQPRDGHLRAELVTITGMAPARPLPVRTPSATATRAATPQP